jgi:hypothetical protein
MLPITFFATAFGLMMEKVRSIAMITSNNKICSVVVRTGVEHTEIVQLYDLARIIMTHCVVAYG